MISVQFIHLLWILMSPLSSNIQDMTPSTSSVNLSTATNPTSTASDTLGGTAPSVPGAGETLSPLDADGTVPTSPGALSFFDPSSADFLDTGAAADELGYIREYDIVMQVDDDNEILAVGSLLPPLESTREDLDSDPRVGSIDTSLQVYHASNAVIYDRCVAKPLDTASWTEEVFRKEYIFRQE